MDPDVTLREFLSALAEGDRETAAERAESLHTWLSRGGYCPKPPLEMASDAVIASPAK